MGMVFMYSCSKGKIETNKPLSDNKGPEYAVEAYYKILDFKERVAYYKENPDYKSGGQMSIGEALWNYNALINFEHAIPDDAYKGFYRDSVFVVLPFVSGDSVSEGDVLAVYLEIEDGLEDIFNTAPFNNKTVKFNIIDVKSTNPSEILIRSMTVIGDDGESSTPPFGSEDDFYYGNNMGMCNGTGAFLYDAGDTICKWINATRYQHIDDEGKIVFYTNPVRIPNIDGNHPAFDNPDDPGTPVDPALYDNYRDYLMFYAHENNGNLSEVACIESPDMNFYFLGTTDAIYNIIPNIFQSLEGKTFMDLSEIDGTNDYNPDGEYYIHRLKNICYATRWVIEE